MKKHRCIISFFTEKGKRYEVDQVIDDLEFMDLRYHERVNFELIQEATLLTPIFKDSTQN